jgi:hypothetical protein
VAQPGDAFAASVLRPRSDVMTDHRVRLRGGALREVVNAL